MALGFTQFYVYAIGATLVDARKQFYNYCL